MTFRQADAMVGECWSSAMRSVPAQERRYCSGVDVAIARGAMATSRPMTGSRARFGWPASTFAAECREKLATAAVHDRLTGAATSRRWDGSSASFSPWVLPKLERNCPSPRVTAPPLSGFLNNGSVADDGTGRDALVGDYLGVALGGVDGVAVTGQAWRSGRVDVRLAEEVLPGMGRTRRPTAPWRHGTGFGSCNQRITLPSAGTAGAGSNPIEGPESVSHASSLAVRKYTPHPPSASAVASPGPQSE